MQIILICAQPLVATEGCLRSKRPSDCSIAMSLTYPAECVGMAGGSVLGEPDRNSVYHVRGATVHRPGTVVGTLRPRVMSGHRFTRIRRYGAPGHADALPVKVRSQGLGGIAVLNHFWPGLCAGDRAVCRCLAGCQRVRSLRW